MTTAASLGGKLRQDINAATMNSSDVKKVSACSLTASEAVISGFGAEVCPVQGTEKKEYCNARIVHGDIFRLENDISTDYQEKTVSGKHSRRAAHLRSPASSATNQLLCGCCGSDVQSSRFPAENEIYHASVSDEDLRTDAKQSRNTKQRSGERRDDSKSKYINSGEKRFGCDIADYPQTAATCRDSNESFELFHTARNPRSPFPRTRSDRVHVYNNMLQCSSVFSELLAPRVSFVTVCRANSKTREQSNSETSLLNKQTPVTRRRRYLQRPKKNLQKNPIRKPNTQVGKAIFGTRRNTTRHSLIPRDVIPSWIIFLFGYLLNWTRTVPTSVLYRKSKGLRKNCATLALWALVILPGDSKRVLGNSLLVSPGQFCTRTRFLNARQQEICQNKAGILRHVEEGVLLGSHRCQKEFQYNRWNCSSSSKTYYSRLLNQDVRETAYVSAVTSAAVTYAVTYACTKGDLPNCGCAERSAVSSYELLKAEARKRNVDVTESQLRHAASTFEWGGCSDVVSYGAEISRIFTDHFGRKQQSRDLRGRIEEHNFEAGRLVITDHMRRECRCHGFTGTCTIQTCWDKMPKWQDVGTKLRAHFDKAVRVQLTNDGQSLLPTRKQRLAIKEYPYPRQPYPDSVLNRFKRSHPGISPPGDRPTPGSGGVVEADRRRKKKRRLRKSLRKRRIGGRTLAIDDEDLVYSQESPNFCKRIRKHGTMGTSGRRCIPNSSGAGSCDYLCCGRSYSQHEETVTRPCNCRMESCCKVTCDDCTMSQAIFTCD